MSIWVQGSQVSPPSSVQIPFCIALTKPPCWSAFGKSHCMVPLHTATTHKTEAVGTTMEG